MSLRPLQLSHAYSRSIPAHPRLKATLLPTLMKQNQLIFLGNPSSAGLVEPQNILSVQDWSQAVSAGSSTPGSSQEHFLCFTSWVWPKDLAAISTFPTPNPPEAAGAWLWPFHRVLFSVGLCLFLINTF